MLISQNTKISHIHQCAICTLVYPNFNWIPLVSLSFPASPSLLLTFLSTLLSYIFPQFSPVFITSTPLFIIWILGSDQIKNLLRCETCSNSLSAFRKTHLHPHTNTHTPHPARGNDWVGLTLLLLHRNHRSYRCHYKISSTKGSEFRANIRCVFHITNITRRSGQVEYTLYNWRVKQDLTYTGIWEMGIKNGFAKRMVSGRIFFSDALSEMM